MRTHPTPSLLLHGAYLSGKMWAAQVRGPLGQHFRLLTPTLRGHGTTNKGGALSVSQWSHDLLSSLDRLGIHKVHVCGHSLGGMVAQQLALDAPERVVSLLLVETSYGTRSTPLERLATDAATPFVSCTPISAQASAFAWSYAPFGAALRQYVQQEISAYQQHKSTYLNIWKAVCAFDSFAHLPRITVPTRILLGARNKQTHAQGRTMQSRIAQATLEVVPRTGHLLPLERPSLFSAIAAEFWLEADDTSQ